MPTYEYRCSDCGHTFEAFQRIDEEPLSVCERCGGKLRKVFHPAGIVFKGSGFYATDSRSKSKPAKDGGDSRSETKDTKKDTKTESTGKKEATGSGSSS